MHNFTVAGNNAALLQGRGMAIMARETA